MVSSQPLSFIHNFNRDELKDAPPLNEENNPYKGLQSYDEKDGDLFFGRTHQIKNLYEKVVKDKQRLTLVLGASGTGKSSLVKAGLIPKLKEDDKSWSILPTFRPGESPFKSLNNVLELVKQPSIHTFQATSSDSDLLTLAEQSLANWFNNNPKAKLLVVIDQFEELITLCKSEEREQFEKLIKNSLDTYSDKIHVVITLRLDFEAQFQNSILKDFWNGDARFVVPPMTQDELREVIEKPASKKVLYFDPPSLVDELINEVVQMPGALPLLSFTLSELYLKYSCDRTRDNRALTKKDYEELGRVVGSITKRANQEYDQLVIKDPAYENTVRQVMLRMISLQGGELARRQVLKSELDYLSQDEKKRVDTVIERFSKARLIVEGSNSEGKSYVEPAHDALVTGWTKLSEWKGKDKDTLNLQRRLTTAANDWDELPENEKNQALWTEEEGRLSRLRPVINSEQNWLNRVETDFVNQSIERKLQRFEEQEKQRDEALQGQISALAALSEARFQDDQLGALIHILTAGRIVQQLRNSKSKWIQEDINLRTEVVLRQILSKVKEFNRLEDKDIPFRGVEKFGFTSTRSILMLNKQGMRVPLNSIYAQELIWMQDSQGIFRCWQLDGNLVTPEQPNFSPVKSSADGQVIVIPSTRTRNTVNQITLLTSNSTEPIILNTLVDENLMAICLSPDGQIIAAGGWEGWLYLWRIDGTEIVIRGYPGGLSLNAIDFSPNSNMFVTGGNNRNIIFWNQSGELIHTIENAHRDAIWGVSFSPDGETLASVSTDTTVKIWKTDGTLLTTLNGHRDKVMAVGFNSDGQILASASDDRTVRIWRPNGTRLKSLDDHHTGSVYTVKFNSQQPMIATTSGQGQLILWSQDGKLLKARNSAHNGTITALDFSPNGTMLVTAAGDREVKLWRLDNINEPDFQGRNLGNHTGDIDLPTVFGVSFSHDNRTILLGSRSQDGTGYLELCDSESMSCREIAKYKYKVLAVCFSPDGQMFAVGKGDGSVELWKKEENDFQLLKNFQMHDNLILAVCFSLNGQSLATASADTTAKLWQIDHILNNDSTMAVTPTNILSHTDRVTAVRFSPQGDLIATASYDNTVKLWNLDGILKKTLHGHNERINGLDFSPDGKILASASNDKTAILWNLNLEIGLDQLIDYGSEWIRDYLTNNPNVSESDQKVLSPENFPPLKYESQRWK